MADLVLDSVEHAYYLDGVPILSITQMLTLSGWVDPTWYTADSAARGSAVHGILETLDRGLQVPSEPPDDLRGYVGGYLALKGLLRPSWGLIEAPVAHPDGWAGTPDRVGLVSGVQTVCELKTGQPDKSHAIQLALQAILVSPLLSLPPEAIARVVWYLKPNGRFRVVECPRRQDFAEARKILQEYL